MVRELFTRHLVLLRQNPVKENSAVNTHTRVRIDGHVRNRGFLRSEPEGGATEWASLVDWRSLRI